MVTIKWSAWFPFLTWSQSELLALQNVLYQCIQSVLIEFSGIVVDIMLYPRCSCGGALQQVPQIHLAGSLTYPPIAAPELFDFVRQHSDITFTLLLTTNMPTDTTEPDLFDLLDDLNGTVKSLGSSAAPLTSSTVQDISTHLTVADKARLYVLTTYAIESLLFGMSDRSSYL